MRAIHTYWAYIVVLLNLAAGLWGVYLWRKKRDAPKQWWYVLVAAWISIWIQGFLGLLIYNKYKPPLKHTFYGFLFVIITIAIFPLRGEEKPRTRLTAFAWATLFIGIVAVRAIISGRA